MCTPMAAAGFGIQALGSATNFVSQLSATNAYNAAAQQNAMNASVAATRSYEDEGKKYAYNMRELQQQGYKAAMQGRQAQGAALASAGSVGFDASSLSVNSILAAEAQKTATNLDNVKTKQMDQLGAYDSATHSLEAQAQGRANSMPIKSGPNPLALGINIAGEGMTAAKSAGYDFFKGI